jgi:fermentation-respiration switch protein FrsA (DUF1100 family)
MRSLRATVLVLFVLLLTVVAFFMWDRFIEGVVFQPSRSTDLRAARLGIAAEDVFLEAEDGVRIHSFYLPAHDARCAILFLHGNAGNASHRLPNAAELVRLGCSVLLLDYRGYGLSDGRASEAGVYADARAGLRYLTEERRFPEERIVLFGRSLGSAVAVDLAQDRDLAGVVLESSFPSIAQVGASLGGPVFRFLAGTRFDSASKISRVRAPLLFFHGDRDRVIDFSLGRSLFEAAPHPKAFETLSGAGHNDTVQVGGRPYFDRIGRFLDETVPGTP